MIAAILAGFLSTQALPHRTGDSATIYDPGKPVSMIGRTSFQVEYFTAAPCATRIELRQGSFPRSAFGHKIDGPIRIIEGIATKTTAHRLTITGLKPGTRYYYRAWDPGAIPTASESKWGAASGWRREFAASTLAPVGQKTIIRLPVKVLLMPNVINVESAYQIPDSLAPTPSKITPAQLAKIKAEFAIASRVLWVASGMRYWVDFQFAIDDRWERWGPEVPNADSYYSGWPACRSYPGQDFLTPGGGDFTIVDFANPLGISKKPIMESKPFAAQIEMAWPRRWNTRTKEWEFYSSGGGTYGVEGLPEGIPGRSQFLAGNDTSWLVAHEFHHQMESEAAFWLSDREDERITFDHPSPRHRTLRGDGSADEQTWTTNGRHGENWDVLAYWDRRVTDAQWLRCLFGETLTVIDKDEDGFPDNDLRLPLDEKRFGSSPLNSRTDGQLGDLDKAMLASWAPGPLQSSWTKPPFAPLLPSPTSSDSNGNGIPDAIDPNPLVKEPAIIPARVINMLGETTQWSDLPVQGELKQAGLNITFKHCHDERAYYGYFEIHGPWRRIAATFDGEGNGVFGGPGVLGFDAVNGAPDKAAAGPKPIRVELKPAFGGMPGMRSVTKELPDGGTAFMFSYPNRGDGPWYWKRGGREIGVVVNVYAKDNTAFSMWEPYRPLYCRMLEPNGQYPLPQDGPQSIAQIGSPIPSSSASIKAVGASKVGETWLFNGTPSTLLLENQTLRDFDFFSGIDGAKTLSLAAYAKPNKVGRDEGYLAEFTPSQQKWVIRVAGVEIANGTAFLTPGRHKIQLSRRTGEVWLLLDGKVVAVAPDPTPRVVLDRVGVLGEPGQTVFELRLRKSSN